MKFQGSLENLLRWSKSHGAYFDNVEFAIDRDKGVHGILKNEISLDEPLIIVPEAIFITPELAKRVFGLDNPIDDLSLLLLAKLKFDKKETLIDGNSLSKMYEPYIAFLPDSCLEIGLPSFWTDDEQELLKGTDAYPRLKRTREELFERWNSLMSLLNEQKKLDVVMQEAPLCENSLSWKSFEAFSWAYSIYCTRAFPNFLRKQSERSINGGFLCPIVDLLNHKNGEKVTWTCENNSFVFKASAKHIRSGEEIYNNYGNKSNTDLLLNYGFVLNDNESETTTLTLKVEERVIEAVNKFGLKLPEGSSANGICFNLSLVTPLPKDLLRFMGFLHQLSSEKNQYTLRMHLEGISRLRDILASRIATFRSWKVGEHGNINKKTIELVKRYRSSQKSLFQRAYELCDSIEKSLIQKYKPLSLQKALKVDTEFAQRLTFIFGTNKLDEIEKKGLSDQVLLLFIMRCRNLRPAGDSPLRFISDTYENVRATIKITKEDVLEYSDLYHSLFPYLSQKIPEIFAVGDYSARSMIIAGTVVDRIVFKRKVNGELYLLQKVILE
ncbi:hypothetical protein KL905_002763 [Ogataea polymorpha]|uniref:Uncharacterized protein n=1 Tax=Ogataea polymorpha TaxID=460523 RepID=A0A1B7SQ90_9ASCO|nr:uncharacterized protein OGAPODRAFT_92101 [Ogataea polymorpha]KAG7880094.1 hypothetical protein KL937_002321 [Ogataea polymorpha]KAG7888743.1 hypothetical protein KL936_003130 [Ogataea polymorpha]KAG7893184.1 hypothetical protein KL908_002917 [Ogataea polymorpha]KAG7900621.1 hypothetical protein KL935_002554 [Ogataea polymorpha]KAG7907814.1 hypothetical protein KL906_003231 [Ogataea polymorpha]